MSEVPLYASTYRDTSLIPYRDTSLIGIQAYAGYAAWSTYEDVRVPSPSDEPSTETSDALLSASPLVHSRARTRLCRRVDL